MRTMRTLLAAVALLAGLLLPSVSTAVAASPVIEFGDSFDGDYFLDPGLSTKTKSNSFSASNVGIFSRTLAPAQVSTTFGSAVAKVSVVGTVTGFPDTISGVTASATMSGNAHRTSATAAVFDIPVSSAQGSFRVDISVSGQVPASISVSGTASNNDADDCSEVEASLDGTAEGQPLSIDKLVAAAGGDCGATAQGGISFNGVLTGGTTLQVSADGTVAAVNKGSTKTFAASFNVSLRFPAGACTVTGTSGDDPALDGTSGADVICGMGGTDTIHGLGGNDWIVGGSGQDSVDGGPGDDTIWGLDGADILLGGTGSDTIDGGAGEDAISGQGGPNALLAGGADNDGICGSNQKDTIHGDGGNDLILGFGGPDGISGGSGNDSIQGEGTADEALLAECTPPAGSTGTLLNDTISGGTGDDFIEGGGGNDLLKGEAGSDKLLGDAGNDTLIGGTRKDVFNGGVGDDVINACDGVLDTVGGGPGHDSGKIDVGKDTVASVEVKTRC